MVYHGKFYIRILYWAQSILPYFLIPVISAVVQLSYIFTQKTSTIVFIAMLNLWSIMGMIFWYPFILWVAYSYASADKFLLLFNPTLVCIKLM
jgi:hypothetical protein